VELNPVVAGMVKNPWDYKYSSVHAHLSGKDELGIINPNPLLDLVDDWRLYLKLSKSDKIDELQKTHTHRKAAWRRGFCANCRDVA